MSEIKRMTQAQWEELGVKLFGEDKWNWQFKCPCCHYVGTAHDYKRLGASSGAIAFSCLGRYMPDIIPKTLFDNDKVGNGPCDYTAGGLLNLCTLRVIEADGTEHSMFDFAYPEGYEHP